MKTLTTSTLLCLVSLSALLRAQTFDNSANATFKGAYYLRHVLLSGVDQKTGAIARARSLIGTATLDGNGSYTFTGTLMDSSTGAALAYNFTGKYQVASNGLAKMQNPIETQQTVDGGVGLGAFVGSTTESLFQDLLIMIPAGTSTVTNTALLGSYRVGTLDYLQGNSSLTREAYFTLTSAGNGNLGNVNVNGSAVNLNNTNLTQTSAANYTLSAQGSGTITFPSTGTAQSQLVSGTKTLFLSADANLLLAGSPTGFDMLIGIRAPTGSNPAISGTFYAAGFDQDASTPTSPIIDAFYGSLNGTAAGMNYWHQRLNPINTQTYDFTFASSVSLDSNGAASKAFTHYDVGGNGKALLIVGRASQYTLALGLHTDTFSPSPVFLNPVGVVNAGDFSPITNSVAPNEFISLFGSNLSPVRASAQTLPLQTTLGGVSVSVNGRPATLFFVSPEQINALVPFNTPESYATIQVNNNGVSSNAVTVYANDSSPGVFTLDSSGIGAAAALHSDFTIVNAAKPAKPAETILVYMTGLGAVTPPLADGAGAPGSPLSSATKQPRVFFSTQEGLVSFAGLAPGFAGLYQINVQIPGAAAPGSQLLSIDNADAFHQEASINIASASTNASNATAAPVPADSESYRPRPDTRISVKRANQNGRRQ
jgi:uncharacterized protein (TIGR03437 family)